MDEVRRWKIKFQNCDKWLDDEFRARDMVAAHISMAVQSEYLRGSALQLEEGEQGE